MKIIPLRGEKAAGRVALVDDEDWPVAAGLPWYALEQERKGRITGPYAFTPIRLSDGRQTSLYMHKLITGWPMTDHIDHDGLNNQRYNLRPATRAQNQQNQRLQPPASSRYKGVSRARGARKWRAAIGINGKHCYLGLFASEEEAAIAYNVAAIQAYGHYACLNPVGEYASETIA